MPALKRGRFGPTRITLPFREDVAVRAQAAVDYFQGLVPYALLFTQSIRSLCLQRHDVPTALTFAWERVWPDAVGGIKSLIWREKQTKETVLLIGDGEAKSPQDLGFARIAFLVELTPSSQVNGEARGSVTRVKVKMPGDPIVWVLAPTKADAGRLPFLVSGSFVVNEGRGDLRQGADRRGPVEGGEVARERGPWSNAELHGG